jgi:hypothetical protein
MGRALCDKDGLHTFWVNRLQESLVASHLMELHTQNSLLRKKKCEMSVGRSRGVVLEYTLQV